LTSLPRGGRQVLGADLNRWQGARPGLGESDDAALAEMCTTLSEMR
jgi:hypothetical protein